jgi:hypothetical protein
MLFYFSKCVLRCLSKLRGHGIIKGKINLGVISLKKQKPISFDELLKELQGKKTIEEDKNHISLDKLFNESFMSKCSSFKSFGEFLEKGNFAATTQEEINNIHDELFDRHVVRETNFENWQSMLDKANMEYAAK